VAEAWLGDRLSDSPAEAAATPKHLMEVAVRLTGPPTVPQLGWHHHPPRPTATPGPQWQTTTDASSRSTSVAIITDPDSYYVNVHTMLFPAGAVRGQLDR
jgi:hypothetical protein